MLLSEFSDHNKRVEALRARQTRDAALTTQASGLALRGTQLPWAAPEAVFKSRAVNQIGQVWDGLRTALDSIPDPEARQRVVDEIAEGLEEYKLGTKQGAAATDHLSSDGASGMARLAAMNRAARRHWNQR